MDFTAKLAVVHNDALMVFKGYMTYIIPLDKIQSLSKGEEHTRLVYYVRSGETVTLTLSLEYYKAIRDALKGCLDGNAGCKITGQGSAMVVNQSIVQRSTIEGLAIIDLSDVSSSHVAGSSRAYRGAMLIRANLRDQAQVSCKIVNSTIGGEVILDIPRLEINGCTINSMKQFMVLANPYDGSSWPVAFQDGKVLFKTLDGMTENMTEAVGYIYNLFSPPIDESHATQRELIVELFEAFYVKAENYLRYANSNQGYIDEAIHKGIIVSKD